MVHDLSHLARDMEAVAAGHTAHLHAGVIPFISGQIISSAIQRTTSAGDQRLLMTLREGDSHQLLEELRNHSLDLVVARASATLAIHGLEFEVLYTPRPRHISHRRPAAQLDPRSPNWTELTHLTEVPGSVSTPTRDEDSHTSQQRTGRK